jgi:hypothetical protein
MRTPTTVTGGGAKAGWGGVEEGLAPVLVAVVVADDRVAEPLGALAAPRQRRHVERDVVNAGAVPLEEAVHEASGRARRLDHLDAPGAREVPVPEGVRSGRSSEATDVGGVVDPRGSDGDVVEDDGHGTVG